MQTVNSALNYMKDGYFSAIDWIAFNPHKTFWAALILLIVALVF